MTDNDDARSEVDSENRDSNRQQQKHATLKKPVIIRWNSALHMVLL